MKQTVQTADAPLVLIVGDFNQQLRADYSTDDDDWARICRINEDRGQPNDDGVHTRLEEMGFRCCLDETLAQRNWTTTTKKGNTRGQTTVSQVRVLPKNDEFI